MDRMFYYMRDGLNRPVVTVCLIDAGKGMKARGVAICSKLDCPQKKVGRAIAFERARSALVDKGGLPVQTVRAIKIMQEANHRYPGATGNPFGKKAVASRAKNKFSDFELAIFDANRKGKKSK